MKMSKPQKFHFPKFISTHPIIFAATSFILLAVTIATPIIIINSQPSTDLSSLLSEKSETETKIKSISAEIETLNQKLAEATTEEEKSSIAEAINTATSSRNELVAKVETIAKAIDEHQTTSEPASTPSPTPSPESTQVTPEPEAPTTYSIAADVSEIIVEVGKTVNFHVTLNDPTADFPYRSVLPADNIADFGWYGHYGDGNLYITGKNAGETSLTIAEPNFPGASLTIPIKVVSYEVTNLTINCPDYISLNHNYDYEATFTPENASVTDITWTSSNPDVISANSLPSSNPITMYAHSLGTSRITATATNGVSASCFTNVIYVPATSFVITNKTEKTLFRSGDQQIFWYEIIPYDASNKAVTWTSSNPEIATIMGDTGVLYRGNTTDIVDGILINFTDVPGYFTITATTADGLNESFTYYNFGNH